MTHTATIEGFVGSRKRILREISAEEKARLSAWAERNPFLAGVVDGGYINANLPLILLQKTKLVTMRAQKVIGMREAEYIRAHSGAYALKSKDITYDRLHAFGRVVGFFGFGFAAGKVTGAAWNTAVSILA